MELDPRLRRIADKIGRDESPLHVYEPARELLEWSLQSAAVDPDLTPRERRAEIRAAATALAAIKPIERMWRVEQKLRAEDAEVATRSEGPQVARAVQASGSDRVVSRRGRPPKQSLR